MKKNIILIPPCFTYGDCLSVIGMLYFLLDYYEKVYFYVGNDTLIFEYYLCYFSNDKLLNERIFVIKNPEILLNNSQYGEYHICNTLTAEWDKANYLFYDNKNIDSEFYFNDLNPLYNKLNIDKNHIFSPNLHLPNKNIETNHLIYYKLLGINNNVRMDYFNYERNIEKEKEIKYTILKSIGINEKEKYNIINDSVNNNQKLINNDLPIVNINFLAKCAGDLLTLLEDSETIHFVEGNNVNFFYHSQYKNIFKYDKKIYFHIWLRNRNWTHPNMNLDYAWKMMDEPKLNNWIFIFNQKDLPYIL